MQRALPSFTIASILAVGLSALQGALAPAAGLLEAAEVVPQTAAADTSELVVRRIWVPTGGAAPMGTVSADGRLLSFTDWSTGDVAVLDLTTLERRRLTDSPFTTGTRAFAEFSVMSPDATEVAYSWFNGTHYELRLVRSDGGDPRVLYGNPQVSWLKPQAWSPDGSKIAALIARADGAGQIALISVADGSARVLKSVADWRVPHSFAFSPDGSQIAYTFPANKSGNRQDDIFILAADGSRETIAVDHPADDLLFGWMPDGDALLFGSDRSEVFGLWAINVSDGKPRGAPMLLKPELWGGLGRLGTTVGGSMYFTVATGRQEAYTATLSPDLDALVGEPVAVGGRYQLDNVTPSWSPDGRNLAFVARSQRLAPGIGAFRIVVRSMTTGETRDFVPQLTYLARLRWSSDGRSFLVGGADEQGRRGQFRVDGYTGDAVPLLHGRFGGANWSRDGKTIFYHTSDPSDPLRVLARDIESGETRELYVGSADFMLRDLALSPDEQRLALIPNSGDALQLVPVRGGSPEDLPHPEQGRRLWSARWTPDGEHLLVTHRGMPGSADFGLWKVPVDGSPAEQVGGAPGMVGRGPALHPDGRQIAYISGQTSAEVWVVENLSAVLGSRRTAASRP